MAAKYRAKRKLFYPAGFLSLALFPIICLHQLTNKYVDKTKPQHCLGITFPSKHQRFPGDSICTPEFFAKSRIYCSYFLTKNTQENKIELDKIKKNLNFIKESKDTINGIHISLADSTPYKDFIKLIDISNEKWAPVYCVNQNDFWSFTIQDTAFERMWRERQNRKIEPVQKKTTSDVFD